MEDGPALRKVFVAYREEVGLHCRPSNSEACINVLRRNISGETKLATVELASAKLKGPRCYPHELFDTHIFM